MVVIAQHGWRGTTIGAELDTVLEAETGRRLGLAAEARRSADYWRRSQLRRLPPRRRLRVATATEQQRRPCRPERPGKHWAAAAAAGWAEACSLPSVSSPVALPSRSAGPGRGTSRTCLCRMSLARLRAPEPVGWLAALRRPAERG